MSISKTNGLELSVIVPAYNEAMRIGAGLTVILEYLRTSDWSWELIIVDDGSRDKTAELVQAAIASEPRANLIHYQPNRGKGHAVRTGVLAAHGKWVAFLDADLSTPVEEIENALHFLEAGEDMVIGSRAHPEAQIIRRPPPFRRFASGIFDAVRCSIVGLQQFPDTQCGFKIYRREAVRPLYERAVIDRFMFDVEILYLAEQAELRMQEMPVQWADAAGSKVRFFAGVYQMLRDLIRIRWAHRDFCRLLLPPVARSMENRSSEGLGGRR